MLSVLRERNFALLWVGGLISALGDSMLLVALPFYVYQRTGSALATGATFIVSVIPQIVFGSIAGVFVDRWDRRRTMIVCDLLRAFLLVVLLVTVRSPGLLWTVYLIAFLQATVSQFFGPANGALLPLVVGKERLLEANALGAISGNVQRLIGPTLGGALLGIADVTSVLLADAASFVFSAILIAFVRLRAAEGRTPTGIESATVVARWGAFWRDWTAGLRIVSSNRAITAIFMVGGSIMLAQGLVNALLPVFVRSVLRMGALEFGWIATAQGVGGLLGGVIVGRAGKLIPPARLIAVCGVSTGAFFLAMINARDLPLILMFSAMNGLPVMGLFIGLHTLLQTSIDDQFRGRVLGAYITTGALLMLAGLVLASGLGDSIGALPLLDIAGGLIILAGIQAAIMLPRQESQSATSQVVPEETSSVSRP